MTVGDDDGDKGDGDREGAGGGVGDDGRRRDCVGDDDGVDEEDGVGDSVGGTGDSVGDRAGPTTSGSSVGCVSAALVDCSLGAGVGVRLEVDPGSDQSPTLSPLTKVVCNLV